MSLSLERLPKTSEVAKFFKVLWKTNQEQLPSHEILLMLYGGEQLCSPHHKNVCGIL